MRRRRRDGFSRGPGSRVKRKTRNTRRGRRRGGVNEEIWSQNLMYGSNLQLRDARGVEPSKDLHTNTGPEAEEGAVPAVLAGLTEDSDWSPTPSSGAVGTADTDSVSATKSTSSAEPSAVGGGGGALWDKWGGPPGWPTPNMLPASSKKRRKVNS